MNSTLVMPQADAGEAKGSKITCPNCRNTKVVDVAKYRGAKSPIKARCNCGCVFDVSLKDLRRFYRKKANLPGSYSCTNMGKTGVVRVKNLSYSGVGFQTEKEHEIEVGDILGIRFMLDDGKKTELRRTVEVKSVRGRSIGAEFCDSQGFDAELCYYLMLS
jgi:hypothetical protein